MIPTPDLSHLKAEDYGRIYEPAEDTFILLDALEEDAAALRDLQPRVCLEIGSGSGCVPVEPVLASLTGPLRKRLRHSVDILLFNPPYVPTELDEADEAQHIGGITGAWAGGQDGMAVTDILLDQVEGLLTSRGRFYLVAVNQNDIPGICRRMQDQYGLKGEVALQRRAGREHLYVLRFLRH